MIPRAIAATLKLPPLTSELFTPTKWASGEDKAKFGNHLLRFIAEDFPPGLWRKELYQRLSNCFSNIAHYNIHGFWETWFTSTRVQIEFLENIARYPCWGDAAWTFCDVEAAVKARIKPSGILDWKRDLLRGEVRIQDLAELARLRAIYETPSPPGTQINHPAATPLPTVARQQADLFAAAQE
jgi:hypothetical protein